ncbi:ATP synthase F1 subunit epsilon [Pedobacter glucosidilyticus]|uniref:ATP synthase F1 subunit epsilon n=1 Tax=Pedobacter glucosidilyticus TaxID=1122941 RepID=UPI000429139B|nr:ATP synthase F1 subunit epsilon [Pedobacter glucosidilyticus]
MNLEILTPDKKVFDGEVISVTVPGTMGSFEVLNNHAPIISTLEKGQVTIRTATKTEKLIINGGAIEVIDNKIIVLAEGVIES